MRISLARHAGPCFLPGGKTKTLLHIRRWSFHWQQDYRFSAPVPLPRGTTIAMRFTYDNSDANKDNPKPAARPRRGRTAFHGRNGKSAPAGVPLRRPIARCCRGRRRACGGSEPGEGRTNGPPQSGERGGPDITWCELHRRRPIRRWYRRSHEGDSARPEVLEGPQRTWWRFVQIGQSRRGGEQFKEAARLGPTEASVQFNLGKTLIAAGSTAPDASR